MTTAFAPEPQAGTMTALSLAPKHLYRLVETALGSLAAPSEESMLRAIAERMLEHFGEPYGVQAWAVVSDPFEADLRQGDVALADALRQDSHSPDPRLVAWPLRGQRDWRLAFRVEPAPGEAATLVLHLARAAAQQLLSETGWSTLLDRARAIQQSLLPRAPFGLLHGFDIHGRSDSAAVVGGDVFDVQSLSAGSLSILLADASGHGLPAALQARDIVIGLRMGHENHLKIGSTIEKLNRVLCTSSLSSQFVSLVYGEIDREGVFQYVNAGHPSPILLARDSLQFLPQTGPVLGVSEASRYRVAHAVLPPSSMLVLYSDGVIESAAPDGEEFGVERLVATCLEHARGSAAEVANSIFDATTAHRGRTAVADDATVLVVRRD